MVFDTVLTKVFGTANERVIKKLWPVVAEINALEPSIQALSDDQLRAKTVEFRARIAQLVAEQTKGIEDREEKEKWQATAQPSSIGKPAQSMNYFCALSRA